MVKQALDPFAAAQRRLDQRSGKRADRVEVDYPFIGQRVLHKDRFAGSQDDAADALVVGHGQVQVSLGVDATSEDRSQRARLRVVELDADVVDLEQAVEAAGDLLEQRLRCRACPGSTRSRGAARAGC